MTERDSNGVERTRWRRFWRWACTHRIGETQIDPDARVDPAGFSEDEFPVVCSKCEYSLRGLPDGRCPECGTEFRRGRLLVEQYVLPLRLYGRGPGRRMLLLAASGYILLAAIAFVGTMALFASLRRQVNLAPRNVAAITMRSHLMSAIFMCVWFGLLALWNVCLIVLVRRARGGARKRRQVLDAIEPEQSA